MIKFHTTIVVERNPLVDLLDKHVKSGIIGSKKVVGTKDGSKWLSPSESKVPLRT